MSADQNGFIELETVKSLLLGQEDFIPEFARASIQSFSDFKTRYRESLLERDMETLRKSGHKIKPVASMLGVTIIIEEYEQAKTLLNEQAGRDKLEASAARIESICKRVIKEFEQILEKAERKGA
jgi:HPt (histidine-containing phosphotransfer) domain-containing protein